MVNFRYLVIHFSIVIGLILMILPLPDWAQSYRPNWVALILIYWSMALPKQVGLWFALITGLLVDSLQGTLLGQYGLALVIIMYLNLNFYLRIRVWSLPQQSLYVFILLLICQIMVAWVEGIMGRPTSMEAFIGAPVVGMLFWPLVFIKLRDIRRKAMLG